MDLSTSLLLLAMLTGLYMAWNIGANDVANAMGTSVGSGALTLRGALIVAAIFEFGGAMLVGGSVTDTISKGIVDVKAFGADTTLLALGMACCLLAAALWLHLASHRGWPVSTTHSIVGAVVGFGLISGGTDYVNWSTLSTIVASWVVSPVLGGILGFGTFIVLRTVILQRDQPVEAANRWGGLFVFPVFFILTLTLLFKGLKPLHLDLSFERASGIALMVGVAGSLLSRFPLRRLSSRVTSAEPRTQLLQLETYLFRGLQILTACFVAFAHGSNDVANAVGPMAATYSALRGEIAKEVAVPVNMLMIGSVGIVIGLSTYGYKVMGTIGREITELTPSRGFAAEFGAATTIVIASKLGLPVSTTHTLVGAVVGVGFSRSLGALNLKVLRGIVASWFITVPFTALLSAILVYVLRLLLL